jgi:exocyst complex component 4
LLAGLHDELSPVSTSPVNKAGLAFSDPFAADKAQRSELRQQTSDAQQASAAMQTAPSQDRLRNVVGAFMAARRDDGLKRPQRSEARTRATNKQETLDVGPTGGDIDVVLQKIKNDWPFVLESDFSPSTLALSLLARAPSSSLPAHPPLASFSRLHETLSAALQTAVQSHFQTFAASLPQHATFLATLGRAQDQVKQSKTELNNARDGFAGKGKGELAGIRARERQVRDMLRILDTMCVLQ